MQDFRFLLYCSKMDDRFTASSGIPGPVGSGNLEQAIGNNLTGLTGDLGKTGKSFKSRTRLGPNKIDKSRTNLDRSVLWRFMHPCYHIKRSIVRSQFRFVTAGINESPEDRSKIFNFIWSWFGCRFE